MFRSVRTQSLALGADGAWTIPAGAEDAQWLVGGRATYAVQETYTLIPSWWWGVSVAGHEHLDSDRTRWSGSAMVGYAPVGLELGGYADLQGEAAHGGAFVGLGLTVGVASLYARQGVYASGGGTFTDLGIRLQLPYVWKKKEPSWLGEVVRERRRARQRRRVASIRAARMAFARSLELTRWALDELHRRPPPGAGPRPAWQIPTARVHIAAREFPGAPVRRLDLRVEGWARAQVRPPEQATEPPYERVVLGTKSVKVSPGREDAISLALKPTHEARQGAPVLVDRWTITLVWQSGADSRTWVSDPSACESPPQQGRAGFTISHRTIPELCQPLPPPTGDYEGLKRMFFWEPQDVSP